MNLPVKRHLISILLISCTVTFFLFSSCDKKIDTIRKSDIESLPSVTVRDFITTYTDSATKQLEMTSPLMERYTNTKTPYAEFRKGMKVVFFDGKKDPVGTLSSKYAKYDETRKIWELKDSVIAVNERAEVMETELLYWDQNRELVYTDRFVKMTSEDQIVMGTGFQSDPRFMDWHIRNVSASFYIKDEGQNSENN